MEEQKVQKPKHQYLIFIGDAGSGKTTLAKEMQFNCFDGIDVYDQFINDLRSDQTIILMVQSISQLPSEIARSAIGWYIFRNADLVLRFDTKKLKVGEYIYLKKLPRPVHIACISSKVDPLSKNGFVSKYFPSAKWITSIEHYNDIQFELELDVPVVFCFSELPPNVEIDYFIRDS